MKISVDGFSAYFSAVHGCAPFPWQKRLLEDVVANGCWPQTLSLPTGAGKTAVLDVSLFALACGIKTPRRTVLVVDRRVVVDDAYARASRIRDALAAGGREGILSDVRAALLELGGRTAVETALLRGGIYREDNWARDPLQPVLVCSTVDQVGSRLLHQGYGVSPHTRSIHAGLLANDCLIVLDEAHVSEPFRQTLGWIARYRNMAERVLELPFAVVTMTATPRGAERPFVLDATDKAHPALSRRLNARKNLRLVVAGKGKDPGMEEQITAEVVARAAPGKTILVTLNRVKTARDVHKELRKRKDAGRDPLPIEMPILLTGRSRPLERDRLLAPHRDRETNRLFSGRDRARHSGALPLVVVATQCVEVGADLDVDILISEVCPLDSLRQRLGRLDRLGELGESDAVLVAPAEIGDEKWEDTVYGRAPGELWKWLSDKSATLNGNGALDVGIAGWEALLAGVDDDFLRAVIPPPPDAPVMFPAYLDLWVQTSPEPAVAPDPAIFLHGPQRGVPEVQVVWRFDLPEGNPGLWGEIVAECPPVAGEALNVPIYQARQWLDGNVKQADGGGDIEGEAVLEPTAAKQASPGSCSPFLRWRGGDAASVRGRSADLQPGDTIVVPCSRGGCDEWGWNPDREAAVVDLADEARWRGRRTPILRLVADMPEVLKNVFADIPMEHADAALAAVDRQVTDALMTVDVEGIADGCLRAALAAMKLDAGNRRKGIEVLPHPGREGWILRGSRRMGGELTELAAEDDSLSRLTRAVTLLEHTADVGAETAGLAGRLAAALAPELGLAARLHDLGKADPRFQAMLNGGNRFIRPGGELLAKSARMPFSAREAEDVRERAGYPKGARHELLSVRLAEMFLRGRDGDAGDRDLVLHLIASHHGRCRPFAPVVEDPAPRPVSLDWDGVHLSASSDTRSDGMGLEHVGSGVPERFWRLVRRYGWWGLSYLEACLRLADWRASAREESVKDGGDA